MPADRSVSFFKMPPQMLMLIYNNVLPKYTRKIQLGGLYDDIKCLFQYLTSHPKSYASILKQHTHFQDPHYPSQQAIRQQILLAKIKSLNRDIDKMSLQINHV
jgi:hypothetical protein